MRSAWLLVCAAVSTVAARQIPLSIPEVSSPLVSAAPSLNFQIHQPAPTLSQPSYNCSAVLIKRSFANSYGDPSTLAYTPSVFSGTACSDPALWTSLILSLHGSSQGRQFDRLATIWIGNNVTGQGVEVWRHDNPEPTMTGIYWDISKDVGKYVSLFSNPADLVFDLPNIVDRTYTGALNLTLTLTALVAERDAIPLTERAPSAVLPLSRRERVTSSVFTVGGQAGNGTSFVQLPRNTARAIVEIYASGTSTEEFWYTGLPDAFYSRLPDAASEGYYGHGPYREVQLYIDGFFAGFATPYPVIYTGGISPSLWRPSADYGSFDQPTYHIDITPFVGMLTDDRPHNFTLSVVSSERNGTINDASWYVSGNVQLYLDSSTRRTTGNLLHRRDSEHAVADTSGDMTDDNPFINGTLTYKVQLKNPRAFKVAGTVVLGSGTSHIAAWSQSSLFSNKGMVNGSLQTNSQLSSGWTRSIVMPLSAEPHAGRYMTADVEKLADSSIRFVQLEFSYPLYSSSSFTNESFEAQVEQSFQRTVKSSAPRRQIATSLIGPEETLTQNDIAVPGHFVLSHKVSHARSLVVNDTLINGTGTSYQSFSYQDIQGGTIDRRTLTNTTGAISDTLTGSIADRAQPGQL